ncbi:MAG: hypothetical protein PHQ96_06515 [Candidatus Omnitrophica bacterium]|nr:hypothetical protein [Candidatus Omnitrophota bacterium]
MFADKKLIILIVSIIIVAFILFSKPAAKGPEGARNIKIQGNYVSMMLNNKKITAQLEEKSTKSFVVDSGDLISANTGEFFVVPLEKLGSFPDSVNCESLTHQLYKDNTMFIGFIALNPSAELELEKVASLHKGVIEIVGSEIKKETNNKEMPRRGFSAILQSSPSIYYLVDEIKIVKEKY